MILATVARNAAVDAVAVLLNSGTLKFHSTGNSVVATTTFGATAFGAATNGVATANAITSDTNAAGGTIAHAHLAKTDTTEIAQLTATGGGGGGEVQMSSLVIGAGDTVSISSFTLTQAAS